MSPGALVVMCALSAAKPAAVQVCFKTPAGTSIFSSNAEPYFRSLGGNAGWMLDFDVLLDGEKPEKISKAGPSCVRAWIPARQVKKVSVSFDRVPLNFTAAAREVDLKLKPDLWFDAGTVVLEREPFAVMHQRVEGELKLERKTAAGELSLEKPDALPSGEYVVSFVPAAGPTHPCTARVEVVAMGTVTKEKSPGLLRDLSEHYADNVLPSVLAAKKLNCGEAEEVVAEVVLLDGVFMRPMQPKLTKVSVPSKVTTFELKHDDKVLPLGEPVTITVAPGQFLEVVAKPPKLASR
ncbi:MAG: hypothetical protein QM817_32020 [Archangium sp.]